MNQHSSENRNPLDISVRHAAAVAILLALGALLVVGCATPPLATEPALASLEAAGDEAGFLPALFGSPLDVTPTPEPTATPTITPTPEATPGATPLPPPLPAPTTIVSVPPVDFVAARAAAQAQGLDLAFVKIGFHVGPGGNPTGLGDWARKLNDAGVPLFLKSVDVDGPLIEVQNLMKANEAAGRSVPHTLVFRFTDGKYEAPYYNYDVSPEEAAAVSWPLHRDSFPKGLDKSYVWFETHNEPGRYGHNGELQIERLARFSLATAKQAVADGYKYAALSWSFGVPEPEDWEDPAMLEFLRYAGDHPDQVAIALHEYSGTDSYEDDNQSLYSGYPYRLGRFQALFDVCDQYGIPRPTVLITEWGWEYESVPEPAQAIEEIAWASWLYAAYPEVKGASIWYLGAQFGGIANKAQRLIAPLADYSISHYFFYTPGRGQIDPDIFRPPVRNFTMQSPSDLPSPGTRPRNWMALPRH